MRSSDRLVMRALLTAPLTVLYLGPVALAETESPSDTGLEEIVVSGLKRDETLLRVPDAVSVFTAQEIARANITRPGDYLAMVPNVTFFGSNSASETFINIRGQASVRNSESAAAVVIDGVQLATATEFNGELFDIQQIEVFKGPQGAIYGRNASAGAIVITTRAPTDDFEGNASAGYGNFNSSREVFGLSGPVIPGVLRFRVDAAVRNTDGPFKDPVNGENPMRSTEVDGRFRLDWLPMDDLRVEFRANGSNVRGGAIQFNAQEAPPVTAPVCGVVSPAIDANSTAIPYCTNITSDNRLTKASESLKIVYQTGIGELTAISAYNQIADLYQADNFPYVPDSGTPGALTQKYRNSNDAFTQEIRLSSKDGGSFSWMVGAYYLNEKQRFTQIQGQDLQGAILSSLSPNGLDTINPTTQFFDDEYRTKDAAGFANVQYRPIDSVEIALAGRYDQEKRSIKDVTPNAINPVTGALYSAFSGDTASRTFDAFTPKATLTYFVQDQASIYASYGKGFKSGGFNPFGTRQTLINAEVAAGGTASQVFVQDSFNKETSTTYEVGFKSRWMENRLSVEGAVFKTDVKGSQQYEFFPTAGLQAIAELDKVGIKGWELGGRATLLPGLELSAGYGAIDAKIKAFAAEPALVGNPAPYVAKNNATVGLQYVKTVREGLDLSARADVNHTGEIHYIVDNYPGSTRSPITLVNGRIGMTHDKVDFGIWGKNLTNKEYNADVVPLLPFLQAVYKAWPRTYGADISYKF